jgi:hypothetical protein
MPFALLPHILTLMDRDLGDMARLIILYLRRRKSMVLRARTQFPTTAPRVPLKTRAPTATQLRTTVRTFAIHHPGGGMQKMSTLSRRITRAITRTIGPMFLQGQGKCCRLSILMRTTSTLQPPRLAVQVPP